MTLARTPKILLLSGGVGGARLAHGFALLGSGVELTVVVNVGDDFEHLGLYVSPDIDTVLYTLAGVSNREQGWGLAGESWRTLDRLRELGGDDWFRLGDLDLATHLLRSGALASGRTLSQVVSMLAQRMGVSAQVLPASDDRLRTVIDTDRGELEFQHYFVRERCAPIARRIRYVGADNARPSPPLASLLARGRSFDAVVLAPSNPFLSLAPILAIPGLPEALRAASERVIAVSPIIAGKAVKGPAAKLMQELGHSASADGWVRHLRASYGDLIDEWVLDDSDRSLADTLCAEGLTVRTTDTLMGSDSRRAALARWLLARLTAEGQPSAPDDSSRHA